MGGRLSRGLVVVLALGVLGTVPHAHAAGAEHIWSKRLGSAGHDQGVAVATHPSGAIVTAGFTASDSIDLGGGPLGSPGGAFDLMFARYASDGAHAWSKRFGGSGDDKASTIEIDSSENVIVGGSSTSPSLSLGGSSLASLGGADAFVAKYAPDGSHLWSKRLGGSAFDAVSAVATDASGNVVVAGATDSSSIDLGAGSQPGASIGTFVAKYAPDGAFIWSKILSPARLNGIAVDAGGNIVVAGASGGLSVDLGGGPLLGSDDGDLILAKYTSGGLHTWSKRIGGVDQDAASGIDVDGSGNVVVGGYSASPVVDLGGGPMPGAGDFDILLARYTSAGAHSWSKRFGGSQSDLALGVAADAAGNTFFTGNFNSSSIDLGGGPLNRAGHSTNILVARYSPSGAHHWSNRFGGSGNGAETGRDVDADSAGDVVLTGESSSSLITFGGGPLHDAGSFDMVLVKLGDSLQLDHIVVSPASSSIDAGNSQAFTVEGFDENGTSLGDMTGTATFSISPNGSCTGNSCTATVAGPHTVTATVQGISGTASLTVNPGPLASMTLAPASASIAAGQSQAYTAEGFDQYGNSRGDVAADATFSITPDGSCSGSECSANVAGPHTVTAAIGTVTANASLTVNAGPLSSLTLSPASASIEAGQTQAYTVEGFDQHGNSKGDVTAQAAFAVAPNGSCTANACGATVAGPHTVTATVDGVSGDASLQVDPAALVSISISPSDATIQAGDSQTYGAEGFDVYGNSRGDVTAQTLFTIGPDGSCTVNACTATVAGVHTVTGTLGGFTDDATLQVTPASLATIVLNPASATISAGQSQAFTAEGFDIHGNSLGDVTAQATFTIAPNGACTDNTCTATQAGAHTVTASIGAVSANASLQVNPGALDHLVLSPGDQTIEAGQSLTYAAEGFDAYDNSLGDVTAQVTFSISPNGSCTGSACTATVAGAHVVTGAAGAVQATTGLNVVPAALHHITVDPADSSVEAGVQQAFTVTGYDVYGNSRGDQTAQAVFDIAPSGACAGSACSDTVAGAHTVTAAIGTISAQTGLTVIPGPLDHIALDPPASTIEAGQQESYAAEGFDVYGNSRGDVTAQAAFTIAPNGSCSSNSCTATVAGLHTVTAAIGDATGFSFLDVVPGPFANVILTPGNASIQAGGSQAYTAQAADTYGNPLGDITAQTAFTIAPNGSCTGNVCTGTIAGVHTVTGTHDGVSGTATLTITPAPLDHISLSPATATRPAGAFQSYVVEGFDVYGNSHGDVSGQAMFSVSPDGSCHLNSCRGFAVGQHTVTAVIGAMMDTASLTVVPAQAHTIELTLTPGTITANETDTSIAFARVRDSYGNLRLDDSVAIATNGDVRIPATMTPNGIDGYTATITASRTAGEENISARVGTAVANALLREVAGPAIHVALTVQPARVRATPSGGNTSRLTALVSDRWGNPVSGAAVDFAVLTNGSGAGLAALGPAIAPASGVTGPDGKTSAVYTAGRLPGQDVVQAKITTAQGSAQASAAIVVGPPEPAGFCMTLAQTNPGGCRFDFIGSQIEILAADPTPATITVDVYRFTEQGTRELLASCRGVGVCVTTRNVGPVPDGSSLLCEVRGARVTVMACTSRLP